MNDDPTSQPASKSSPKPEEAARGPDPAETVSVSQPDVAATLPPLQAGALRIRCPHCHSAIEAVLDKASDSVACPSCGQTFPPDDDATKACGSATETVAPQSRTLGHLQLLEEVGEGAFGAVWKARDMKLDRIVAVKIPRRGQLEPKEVEKFLREARAAAQLQYPGIVAVHEAGQDGETVYIVSDFVDGSTLAEWLKERRPTPSQAAELCRKIAQALDYAHQHGVVHRDLKPGNVMMDRAGEPHIMDFGLAKRQAGETTATVEGDVLGTPAYMSPEQARGEGHLADARSDVYSLGVMLFEMLTGERPFRGELMMLLIQVIEDDPPPVRRLNGLISRDLETICGKCLEKLPTKRYATAGELADDLGRYLRGEPTRARPVGRLEQAWRWCRRNPVVAALSSAAALLVLTVAIVSTAAYFREAHLKSLADGKTEEARQSEARAEQQQVKAEGNAELARQQKQKAEDEATRATHSEQEAQQSLYFSNIALAYRYLQEGEIEPASEILHRCPGTLRHWEWTFLKGLTLRGRRLVLPDTDDGRVAFSPDGKWIAVGTVNGDLVLWDDIARRVALRHKEAHSKRIAGIAFSPDGAKLATAGEDNVARVWTLPAGELAYELRGHTAALNKGLAFSPDGKAIATAGADQTVRIWDAADGKPGRVLTVKTMPYDLAWQGDSERLLVLHAERPKKNIVAQWNAVSGERLPLTLPCDDSPECAVACCRDGSVVAVVGLHILRVWNIREGKPVEILNKTARHYTEVALSADGKTLAAVVRNWGGIVVDLASGRCVYQLPGTAVLGLSSDGTRVLIRKRSFFQVSPARIHLDTLTLNAGAATENIPLAASPRTLISTPRAVYDAASGAKVLGVGGCISPDRQHLFSLWADRLWVYDLGTGLALRQLAVLPPSYGGLRLAVTSDGRYVAVPDDADRIHVVDAGDGHDLKILNVAKDVKKLSYASGYRDRYVKKLRFAPGNQALAVLARDGWLRVWNWRSGELQKEIQAQRGCGHYFQALEFSPDGKYLATSGDDLDRTIHVWSWPQLRLLHELTGHAAGALSLAFSRDGKRLLSASGDGTLRLWDPVGGQEVLKIEAHPVQIDSAGFSPDDVAIVSTDHLGVTRLWGGLNVAVAPGQTVDLRPWLRQYSAARTSDARSSEAVALASSRLTVIPIPVVPAGGYVLRGKFTRTRSGRIKTVGLLLPAGRGKTMLVFDCQDRATTGLDQVETHGVGMKDRENPTNCPVTLIDGQSYTFAARVELQAEQAEVTVELDDRRIIHWRGPQNALNMWSGWDLPGMMGLCLGEIDATVEQLEFLSPKGAAYLLEPAPTPQRVSTPPGATVVAAPCTVDLLPLVDLERAVFDITAKRSDSGLELSSEKSGRVGLSVWPRGNYEFSGSFTLPEPGSPTLLVPTEQARGLVHWLWHGVSAFETIQGKNITHADNPTRVSPSRVEVGRRHAFRVRVACAAGEADLAVELDGEAYMHWKGLESAITLWPVWDVPQQGTLGVGVEKGRVTFHELTLKMLDGEAWILRSAAAPAAQDAAPAAAGR